ncbi:S41 family peptidase [Mucilaginibacter myungsuensis]|uniref:Tail specific protease domain-containing protein n=1 Tax=Mucilaginibacter myungsuensis TaxID=649104 RepID=A0A929PXH0_9SPHI|nr:S41 family peptidase [Mucilaginibacter myungsuensis]MBE9662242.1 hypothetical protein [Mucilaginibacter myungsuensis]MDN3599322.1 S41 family peptidase [Mucilaginibacter myungsuensis]
MKVKLLFLVLTLITNTSLAQVFDTVSYYKKYPVAQLHQDLDALLKKFEEIHPNYFKETPRDTVLKRYEQLKARITKPLNRMDFMNMFAPMVFDVIKDGHNYVNAPGEEIQQYIDRDGLFFPLPVRIYKRMLFVNSRKADLPYNTQIKSINGVPAQDIVDKILGSYNPENDRYEESYCSGDFSRMFWVSYGMMKQFKITYADGDAVKEIVMTGAKLEQVDQLRAKPQSEAKNYLIRYPNYAYYELPDQRIGVLEYKACADLENFRPFCDSVFTRIRKAGLKDLIIDIRNNDGGTTRLNQILYEYITDKPVAQYTQVDIKVSKESKRDLIQANRKFAGWFKWYHYLYYPIYIRLEAGRKLLLTARNGTMVTQTFQPVTPPKNDLLFKGDIYLLTGNSTYSSAAIFAAAFKCYQLGAIVGQETGEPTCFTGDWVSVVLPNTKLDVAISDRRFLLACGKCDGRGVLPDRAVNDDKNAMDVVKKMIAQKK